MDDDLPQQALLVIATSPNSTEAVVRTLDLLANYYPHCGDLIRHTARVIGGTVPPEERGGQRGIDDGDRLDEVARLMAQGWKRSSALWRAAQLDRATFKRLDKKLRQLSR
jgi:hypothetical protein